MPQITNLTRQLIADLSIALLLAMLGAVLVVLAV